MEGRRTVNLEKLQALRVLNFIRFECVIVRVKSRKMIALSKSNREKIRTVKDQSKTVSGPKWGQRPEERERKTPPTLDCLTENAALSLSSLLRFGSCVRMHSERRRERRC